ncbi:MAG: hypothetical protein IZT59_12285 [Verrucomicrobia bacterium]|nr:hypothetical protein [Verrucomicrobiota bacterium]
MKFKVSSILLMCLLASCEKPAPIARDVPKVPSAPETNLILAASQLALAKSHLTAEAPEKAIPYLEAAITNGSPTEAKILLAESLASARFTVPVTRFSHPYPVTTFVRSDTSLFAAIAGPHPTVVRWDLEKKPRAAAVLFPTGKQTIRHLALSPSGKHLLVHRGDTNLLCLAETLKPVTNLGTFPAYIDSNHLQPFSGNSLLLAHPTSNERTFTFHIRDSATGETLRSESFPLFPKPTRATFQDTTLFIELEDHTRIEIPIIGETIRTGSQERNAEFSPQPQTEFTNVTGNLLRHTSIPPSLIPSFPPSLYPAITGYRLNLTTQSLAKVPTPERLATLSETFPEIPPTFTIHTCETAVHTRLAAAFPEEFPELTAPARAHAKIIEEIFATGDPAAIAAIIRSVPPSGLPTATALFLSLKSKNPAYIRETLAIAENVPHALRSRDIPVPPNYRNEQDWLGYESPDFSEIFTRRQTETTNLLTELKLPATPTEEDVQAFITHLLSPETQARLPREILALSAITVARSLSKIEAQATSSLQLTALAQRLGTPQPEILRTQATALGTLAQFLPAHRAWISLITQQPEATHLPSDYSEAAHSAFENADPDQAAEILRIGLFRFPNDVVLAIRAGWIALLTEQPEQAADYLTRATRIGLPRDEVENTTALLAIAHTQRGDPDTAYAFLQQLTAINEKWADPATIEKLPWPEPLKASLRQLTWE